MEHSKNSDSPKAPPVKPRAPHGSRSGKRPRAPAEPPLPDAHTKRRKAPQGRPAGCNDGAAGLASEEIASANAVAEIQCSFTPVPRKPRHDGWTPERQRGFIGALADTGCVTRACRYVNMSTEGAYWLRRQAGSDSFRAAWEAALNLGVQRLKDEVFERALEGQLHPVFIGGKLKGFKRVKNDRLLMFALRMNARDEYGRRLAATYFDPNASRLHGGSGVSDGGERSKLIAPSPSGEGVGGGGLVQHFDSNLIPTRVTESITGPAVTQAQKDARNAALVAQFDPVAMTLSEIEAMQAMLVEVAARKRGQEEGPAEHDPGPAFVQLREGEFKTMGQLEDVYPVATEEDREDEFDAEEDRWWELE